jgi:phosphoenolpyruvate phosphomutase
MSLRKTTRLRHLVTRSELAFLMEAHSGVSARIVEEAGFEGVWGSGLTISAAFGVRDNNELSWSQVVDHVAFMAEATSIPLLLDGDTGYGNFNNMRRLVRKLEQIGVAGVTIEDKLFPKTNSFLRSERQPLAAGPARGFRSCPCHTSCTDAGETMCGQRRWGLRSASPRLTPEGARSERGVDTP